MCCHVQGRSGLAGSHTGRSFPKRSFARPSWMDEDTVDSAGTSESIFFSKVSSHLPPVSALAAKCHCALTCFGKFLNLTPFPFLRMSAVILADSCIPLSLLVSFSYQPPFFRNLCLLSLSFFPLFFCLNLIYCMLRHICSQCYMHSLLIYNYLSVDK